MLASPLLRMLGFMLVPPLLRLANQPALPVLGQAQREQPPMHGMVCCREPMSIGVPMGSSAGMPGTGAVPK